MDLEIVFHEPFHTSDSALLQSVKPHAILLRPPTQLKRDRHSSDRQFLFGQDEVQDLHPPRSPYSFAQLSNSCKPSLPTLGLMLIRLASKSAN